MTGIILESCERTWGEHIFLDTENIFWSINTYKQGDLDWMWPICQQILELLRAEKMALDIHVWWVHYQTLLTSLLSGIKLTGSFLSIIILLPGHNWGLTAGSALRSLLASLWVPMEYLGSNQGRQFCKAYCPTHCIISSLPPHHSFQPLLRAPRCFKLLFFWFGHKILGLGHIWQCSRIIPNSVFRSEPFKCLGDNIQCWESNRSLPTQVSS